MALSQAEIKQILDAIKAESQDVTALDVATSLNNITSLPAIQAAKMVLAPLALLSKPAQDAAAIANNAAASANTAASNANTAATNANAMATSLEAYGTDVAAIRAAITSLRDDLTNVEADLNALDHDNATEAIESFLDGCKDDETLLAKLTEIKGLITAEASGRAEADTALGVRIDDLASDVEVFDSQHTQSIESLDNRVETNAHSIIDLGNQLQAQAISAQEADDTLRGLIAERNRRFYHLPDNFATEQALFSAAATYVIGSKPLCPGALLLGCVDECWAVYQYTYVSLPAESEASAQSDDAAQAAPAAAPPAVKHDPNVADPANWLRLATVDDLNEMLERIPTVEITADDIVALLPSVANGISTLTLDAEDELPTASAPEVCASFERFRTRLHLEIERGKRRLQLYNPENTSDNGTD